MRENKWILGLEQKEEIETHQMTAAWGSIKLSTLVLWESAGHAKLSTSFDPSQHVRAWIQKNEGSIDENRNSMTHLSSSTSWSGNYCPRGKYPLNFYVLTEIKIIYWIIFCPTKKLREGERRDLKDKRGEHTFRDVCSCWHSYLQKNYFITPRRIFLEKLLKCQNLLRYAFNHVQSVHAQHYLKVKEKKA